MYLLDHSLPILTFLSTLVFQLLDPITFFFCVFCKDLLTRTQSLNVSLWLKTGCQSLYQCIHAGWYINWPTLVGNVSSQYDAHSFFCSCRLLYNSSGEWSDGTVPILATTAAGFTYLSFLMVGPSTRVWMFSLWFCLFQADLILKFCSDMFVSLRF